MQLPSELCHNTGVGLMFHVDESADCSHHFHGGVLLDAADAAIASVELDAIISQAFSAGLCQWDAELHATDIFSGRNDWTGPVEDRAEVFRASLEVLSRHNLEVIAHGAALHSVRKRYGAQHDPYRWEFSNMLERLNERLGDRDEYAVVIADHHACHRDQLQKYVINARLSGTGGYRNQKLERIVDTAHFVDSKLSRMTQLADLVVFILRRRTSIPKEADPRAEALQAELARLVTGAIPDPRLKYMTVRS